MLVTFRTDAYSNITMFGDIALIFLKIMNHGVVVPGAILADDVPEALMLLSAKIKDRSISQLTPKTNNKEEDDDEPEVSLKNRAIPLINLLKAAAKSESNVMWE